MKIQVFRDVTPCWLVCSYSSVLKEWLSAVGVGGVSGRVKRTTGGRGTTVVLLVRTGCFTTIHVCYYTQIEAFFSGWVVATRIHDRGHLLVCEAYRILGRSSYSTRILYPENGDTDPPSGSMMFALRY